jgi:hypothetical protein
MMTKKTDHLCRYHRMSASAENEPTTAPRRRKLRVPDAIEETETDVQALKWFVSKTESLAAVLIYFDEDEGECLYYGRTPEAVRQCKAILSILVGQ